MNMSDFNGYNFDDRKTRKEMRYVMITSGDLDLNNAYAFKSKKALNEHLKEEFRDVLAVFKVEDVTA
jgi:hypothetical protein